MYGVGRGGRSGLASSSHRCGHRGFSGNVLSKVNSGLGFRLNGVVRGCSYFSASYDGAYSGRDARRFGSNSRNGYTNVGFRSGEWCNKGRELVKVSGDRLL